MQLWYFAGALDMVEGRDPDKSFAEGGRGHWNCFGYIAPTLQSEAVIKHNLKSRMAAYSPAGA